MSRIQITFAVVLVCFSAALFALSLTPRASESRNETLAAKDVELVVERLGELHLAPPISIQRSASSAARNGRQTASRAPQEQEIQPRGHGKPRELRLVHAPRQFTGDLRQLPYVTPVKKERPEREPPEIVPVPYRTSGASVGGASAGSTVAQPDSTQAVTAAAAAPTPSANFDGLDFANWGAGHPPDTNGDVGKDYFIQTVNTSIGIYRKSDGVRVAAFTFDTFMSQGNFGNLCDTDNFGDPVVLYDTFEDRWVITDFAFQLDASDNVINPPGAFQCFAVSKTGDPVNGGWNFYSINTAGGLGDYPKFGIWPDGLYMSVNMFDYASSGSFQNVRLYALNKAQMYAGAPNVQSVSFDVSAGEFTLLPANARLQAGTPPLGSPNYFGVVWQFTNATSVYKFHVDWNSISTTTLTGPFITIAPASWADPPSDVPSQGGNNLDTLAVRLMMQNQYTNLGGTESLWMTHTVQGSSSTQSAVRFYQVGVTGGAVAANTTQAFTHNPDTTNRFMPSLAVDRSGDMALGYSTSSSTSFPAIKYAGRLSSDAANSLPQTETSLINGTGTQNGNCGGTCTRWGDYSAMSLDPDGCTFWYTNEYYATTGLNDLTRIGAFKFSQCTPVGNGGTVSGTVTVNGSGTPISGATVALGSRTTTTNGSGAYSFTNVPAGTYPSISAVAPGYVTATTNNVSVADGATATRNFALTVAPASGCLTDTSQADFQTGIPTNVDLTSSPGAVTLFNPPTIDQQNTSLSNSGNIITTTSWGGQTFLAGATGQLVSADVNIFCSGCTGTAPNLTMSLRATSSGLPTGSDLATATIPGSTSGAGGYYTGTFASPPTITAGTTYALIVRPTATPSVGNYALTRSTNGNVYPDGTRITSSTSGSTWAAQTTDLGFHTYVKSGFATSGNLISGSKDANPATGRTATWSTLSWNATAPAGTTLKFQIAASNNPNGPFNFVGPNGSAATFFTTSGASLSQFNGSRYLKYTSFFNTTNTANTPTLNDVSLCFDNRSNNANLSNLSASAGAISPAFSPATLAYSLNVPYATASTTVTPTLADTSATVTVNGTPVGSGSASNPIGLNVGTNIINTAVTAQDGTTTKTYTISVTRTAPSSNANLSNLSLSAGALSPGFLPNVIAYSLSVPNATTSTTVTPTVADANATVKVNGTSVTSGNASNPIALNVGGNNISVAVTAEDGTTIKSYAVTVTRRASQTISFNPISARIYGDAAFDPGATASSGLSVSYSSSNPAVATISGNLVNIVAAGSANITASQSGDSNFDPAASVMRTLTVNQKGLTITGLTGNNKVYDRNTIASFTGTPSLNGVLAADNGNVVLGGTPSAMFDTPGVGTNKPIMVSGYSLTGSAAGNYFVIQPVLAGDITRRGLTITGLTGDNKVYDRTLTASFTGTAALNGVIADDENGVALGGTPTATFATVAVGNAKTITVTGFVLTGSASDNYSVAQPALTGNITELALTVEGALAQNKPYDGNTSAVINGSMLVGVIAPDDVDVSGGGMFADKNVGSNKPVTAALSLGGADASNYSVTQPAGLTAEITAKDLHVTGAAATNRPYDGTTVVEITGGVLSGVIAPDSVTLGGSPAGNIPNADAGMAIPVTVTGYTIGGDVSNYALVQPTGLTVDIAKASQSISFVLQPNEPKATGSIALSGSASSGLTVQYSSSNPAIGSISGATLNLLAAGSTTVTASQPGDSNYSPADPVDQSIIITGPIGTVDQALRQPNTQTLTIPLTTLLANDTRIAADGSVQNDNLTITGITSGTGNTVSLSGGIISYTPDNPIATAPLTFSYTLSDSVSTDVATVTVSTIKLNIILRGTAMYNGSETSITVQFASIPDQTYAIEYSTNLLDLNGWVSAGQWQTTATGIFAVTITASGDHTAEWNHLLLFRGSLIAP